MRGSPAVLTVVGFIALWWCGEGVETAFDLRFEYEDPTSLLAGQTSVGGPRLRWNTQSVIAGFGMERGARVELQVADLQAAGAGNITEVPVVFTLYDIDQWRAYAVLKLREVHIQSNYVLCHYPAALRFAVPPPDPLAVLPWTVSFDVRKPSLYTLQAQVCGDASVNVTGRVSMVNLGYDGKLSEHLGVQELGLRPLYKGTHNYLIFHCYEIANNLTWVACSAVRGVSHCNGAVDLGVLRLAPHHSALLAKVLSIALKFAFYRGRSVDGETNTALDIAQDVGESATSAALLGVSALGSLGWSITRARLSRREFLSLLLLAATYLVVSFSKALCRPADAPQCRGFVLSEYALQSMMMLGVIVALNFTIAQLKLTANYERWNCFVTPLTYMKLAQFHDQYWSGCPSRGYIRLYTARSTAPDIPNRDTIDPIEPPSLEPRQEDPVRPEATSTNNGSAAATPIDYPSTKIHGQSAFDVFVTPVVSTDGTSVCYDGFATFTDEDIKFTYLLADGVVYVVKDTGNDTTPVASETVFCLSALTPFDSTVAALNNATARASTSVWDEALDCIGSSTVVGVKAELYCNTIIVNDKSGSN
ncbi:hypothetical protein ON010_g2611 [Phytophthora cinnamomi]|nr:hypothetical protein ON010_g2611 [Phytophthora cinnamomi]